MQSVRLKLHDIAPYYEQPRQEFDDARTAELAESLREKGQVEPVVVRRSPPGVERPYQLISGERRWRAAQLIEWTELDAVIREDVGSDDDQFELAVAANAAREDLSPIDHARTVKRLADMPKRRKLKGQALVKSLAGVFGRSTTWIEQHLRLAGLAPEVQALVESGELKKDAAVALAEVKEPERQAEIAKRVVGQNLRSGMAVNVVKQQVRVEQARAGEAPRGFGPGRPSRPVGATASSDAKIVADLVARARQSAAESALDMPTPRLAAAYRARPAERIALRNQCDSAIQSLRRLRAALDQLSDGGGALAMACLYACAGRMRAWSVVKFGVSSYDEPWQRVAHLSRSRDNPYWEKFNSTIFLSIQLRYLAHARVIEEALKQYARVTLPKVGPFKPECDLCAVGNVQPSGEWLASSLSVGKAAEVFFEHSLSRLDHLAVAAEYFADLFAHAYERFYRAYVGLMHGSGYLPAAITYDQRARRWA